MADYRPDPAGAWVAALRAGTLLVLPGGRADDLRALWPDLGSTDAASRVIDRLTARGVASAPGFALVVREHDAASVRVVVRGPLTVRIGTESVSGSRVATWSERAFDDAAAVSVVVDDADVPEATAGLRLPILEGAVAASVVDWSLGSVGVDAAEESRETVVPASLRSSVPDTDIAGAAEQTMVPAEDTVVGFSRTERPRIDLAERTAAPAAAQPVASTTTIVPPPGLSAGTPLGDHDGLTVAAADIRRLRESQGAEQGRPAERPDPARTDDRLALRMPDGSFEPIAGELLLGRAPVIGRVVGSRVPRPVVIGAGDPDISRTHLRVAVEGGTAVVTDLESRNGTHVVAPGQPPMRLRPSEPSPVLPETVIDLGGGWTVQVVVR